MAPLRLGARGPSQMQDLGAALASSLRAGDSVLLEGGLGAGKTTLAQGVARGLGAATEVTSPTFVLLIEHETGGPPLLHLDAYRLEGLSFEAAREAGLEDFFARRSAVRLVEWPSMIADWIAAFCAPVATWRVEISHGEGDARELQIEVPKGREDAAQVLGAFKL